MKWILICASIVAAFFFEWALESSMPHIGISFPIGITAILYWFWELEIRQRIMLAFVAGIFIDVISVFLFGTATATLLLIAFATEPLRVLFSNVGSYFIRALALGMSVAAYYFLSLPIYAFVGIVQRAPVSFDFILLRHLATMGVLWMIIVPLAIFGPAFLIRSFVRR